VAPSALDRYSAASSHHLPGLDIVSIMPDWLLLEERIVRRGRERVVMAKGGGWLQRAPFVMIVSSSVVGKRPGGEDDGFDGGVDEVDGRHATRDDGMDVGGSEGEGSPGTEG
jgi:hypothetical protein